jgi:hypothetical protein
MRPISFVLLCCLSLASCHSSPADVQVGTESHFLSSCDQDEQCGASLRCIAKRCSRSCVSNDECAELVGDAICIDNPDGSPAKSCDRPSNVTTNQSRGGSGNTAGSSSLGDGGTTTTTGIAGTGGATDQSGIGGTGGATMQLGSGGVSSGGVTNTVTGAAGAGQAGSATTTTGTDVPFSQIIRKSVGGWAEKAEAYVVADDASFQSLRDEFAITTAIDFSTNFAVVLRQQNALSYASPHIARITKTGSGYEVLVNYGIYSGSGSPAPGYEIHIVTAQGPTLSTTFTYEQE